MIRASHVEKITCSILLSQAIVTGVFGMACRTASADGYKMHEIEKERRYQVRCHVKPPHTVTKAFYKFLV